MTDPVVVEGHSFDRKLLLAYMAEHYEAAREHSGARRETLGFLFAAAAALALEASKAESAPMRTVWAVTIVVLGIYAHLSGKMHHRANRIHAETATHCRKLLAGRHLDPAGANDPNAIREAVTALIDAPLSSGNVDFGEFRELLRSGAKGPKPPKIGDIVNRALNLLPLAIVATGLVLFATA